MPTSSSPHRRFPSPPRPQSPADLRAPQGPGNWWVALPEDARGHTRHYGPVAVPASSSPRTPGALFPDERLPEGYDKAGDRYAGAEKFQPERRMVYAYDPVTGRKECIGEREAKPEPQKMKWEMVQSERRRKRVREDLLRKHVLTDFLTTMEGELEIKQNEWDKEGRDIWKVIREHERNIVRANNLLRTHLWTHLALGSRLLLRSIIHNWRRYILKFRRSRFVRRAEKWCWSSRARYEAIFYHAFKIWWLSALMRCSARRFAQLADKSYETEKASSRGLVKGLGAIPEKFLMSAGMKSVKQNLDARLNLPTDRRSLLPPSPEDQVPYTILHKRKGNGPLKLRWCFGSWKIYVSIMLNEGNATGRMCAMSQCANAPALFRLVGRNWLRTARRIMATERVIKQAIGRRLMQLRYRCFLNWQTEWYENVLRIRTIGGILFEQFTSKKVRDVFNEWSQYVWEQLVERAVSAKTKLFQKVTERELGAWEKKVLATSVVLEEAAGSAVRNRHIENQAREKRRLEGDFSDHGEPSVAGSRRSGRSKVIRSGIHPNWPDFFHPGRA